MSVQIWVLTVPRLASPRFLVFSFPGLCPRPSQALTMRVKAENQDAPRVLLQHFRRSSYILVYPVMFRHRWREINRLICP